MLVQVMMMNNAIATVLLVEDSPSDRILVKRAIEDSNIRCTLVCVDNGHEAMQLLQAQDPYQNKEEFPFPDIILLDMNMPIMDGKQTLKAIRANEHFKHIPIVMLTTSSSDKDIIESYRLGVNAYLTKPVEEQNFVEAIVQLDRFWFELITLPQ